MKPIKRVGQVLKFIAIGVLSISVMIAIGLLGYFGMLELVPTSIGLAITAFALAGIVDGEVFMQNIRGGIENLKLLIPTRAINSLIVRELDKHLAQEPTEQASQFEKDYYKQKSYLASFHDKKLSKEQKEEKKAAEKRLKRMQKIFIRQVKDIHPDTTPTTDSYFGEEAFNTSLLQPIRNLIPSFKRKAVFINMSLVMSILAGIGFCFATAAGLVSFIATGGIWPLAVGAGIGFTLMMYRTFSSIIASDTMKEWIAKVKRWFTRTPEQEAVKNKKEKWNAKDWRIEIKYWAKVTGIVLLAVSAIAVGVIATAATAGTWWIVVENGIALVRPIATAANILRSVFVPVAVAANLIFTTRNIMTTVDQIVSKDHAHPKHEATPHTHLSRKARFIAFVNKMSNAIEQPFINAKKEKRLLSLLNPFRWFIMLVSLPFMAFVLIGHFIAIGLTGDRAPGLNEQGKIASAFFGALADTLVDFHYLFHVGKGHQKGHAHDAEHDHSHGLIPKIVLNAVLFIPIILAGLWDYATLQRPTDKTRAQHLKSTIKSNVIGLHEHETYVACAKPDMASSTYEKVEILYRIDKHQHRLTRDMTNHKAALEKTFAFSDIKTQLMSDKPDAAALKQARDILNKQRSSWPKMFQPKVTRSARAADQLIAAARLA